MYKCNICGNEFNKIQGLNAHSQTHNPEYKEKQKEKYLKGANKKQQKLLEDRLTTYTNHPSFCKQCNKMLTYNQHIKKLLFCNHSCSATYNNLIRPKIIYNKKCKQCDIDFIPKKTETFCSSTCKGVFLKINRKIPQTRNITTEGRKKMRQGGLNSVQSQQHIKRSINEIMFFDLCLDYFELVLNNIPMFNGWDADIIIEDYKIAVLWNGKWHYEQITKKHSVKQVQNRDKIKIKEIKNKGYIPYIIKDIGRPGKKNNKQFVIEQFEIFKLWLSSEGQELNLLTSEYEPEHLTESGLR